MATDGEKTRRLREFLERSFSEYELQIFLSDNDYRKIASAVGVTLGRAKYCFDVVEALNRRNLIDEVFFDCLMKEFPWKVLEVQELMRFWRDQETVQKAEESLRVQPVPGIVGDIEGAMTAIGIEPLSRAEGPVIGLKNAVKAMQRASPSGVGGNGVSAQLKVFTIPSNSDESLEISEDFRVILERTGDAASPTVLLAVTRDWGGREALSFSRVMRQVKARLIADKGRIKHVVVFCGSWDQPAFEEEHRTELEAHAKQGVRFWFVMVAVSHRPSVSLPVEFEQVSQ
jgi:hypothetical protein